MTLRDITLTVMSWRQLLPDNKDIQSLSYEVRLLVVALFVDVNEPVENYVCFIEAICLWFVPVTS